jgi:hypothetical protein
MLRATRNISVLTALTIVVGVIAVSAQNVVEDYDNDRYYYADRARIDRYLDVEIWTDHADAEYYEGDNITIYFRSNREAFVAIYSIDSRGKVNLLFPTEPAEDNFVRGGVTYSLPGPDSDFDLMVSGPAGVENLQIIASRERFPIPSWYHNSGIVCDWDDRDDFMDYLNGRHFIRYDGQRFAYDRAVVFVNEWEPAYFRPVYYPYYPSWSVCGNVYVDYPWGCSVYINGYYWGCTPLYIPRLLVGWHTITVYDPWGWCWENDFHCSYYNTVVFDKTIIKTSKTVVSKYKEVRTVGYRDPVKAGYPKYQEVLAAKKAVRSGGQVTSTGKSSTPMINKATRGTTADRDDNSFVSAAKKYVRGDSKLVKSDRGYETQSVTRIKDAKTGKSSRSSYTGSTSSASEKLVKSRSSSTTTQSGDVGRSKGITESGKKSSGSSSYRGQSSSSKSTSSGDYYRKKSGKSTATKSRSSSSTIKRSPSSKSKSSTYRPSQPSNTNKAPKSKPSYRTPKSKSSGGSSSKSQSTGSSYKGKSSNSGSSSNSKPSNKKAKAGGK